MAKVFVSRALPGDALDRLRAEHDVTVWDGALPPALTVLREAVADIEGLLCPSPSGSTRSSSTPPTSARDRQLAVGTDNIDLAQTRARGIPVGVTPDVLTEATADLAFALLLAAARRLPEAAAAARNGEWRTWEPAGWLGADVQGASLGIIGFGRSAAPWLAAPRASEWPSAPPPTPTSRRSSRPATLCPSTARSPTRPGT